MAPPWAMAMKSSIKTSTYAAGVPKEGRLGSLLEGVAVGNSDGAELGASLGVALGN